MSGAITLGQLKGRLDKLHIECGRCDRKGWSYLATLLDKHGPDCKLPDLARLLSHDCAKSTAAEFDRCQVRFPDLAKLSPPIK
jgi:hypothetical protein